MKKLFLLAAAALLTLSASATIRPFQPKVVEKNLNIKSQCLRQQTAPLAAQPQTGTSHRAAAAEVAPEGTPVINGFTGYVASIFGLAYLETGIYVSYNADSTKVYFKSLFPLTYPDAWIEGNVTADSITIPMTQVVDNYLGTYIFRPCEAVLDEEGNFADCKEIVFNREGDHIYIDEPDLENLSHYLVLGAFDPVTDEFQGYWDLGVAYDISPIEGDFTTVELPEGAVASDYVYILNDGYKDQINLNQVYAEGNDIYFNGLIPDINAWVKGTKEGDTVTIPGGQFLGISVYMLTFQPIRLTGETDEEGYAVVEPCDLVLTLDPETGIYTQQNAGEVYAACTYDAYGDLYSYYTQIVVKPYAGEHPAVPADPYNLEIADYTEDFGQYYFGYALPNLSVDGDYLNPDNLYYRLYLDDEVYVVGPDGFAYVSEEMEVVPSQYRDEQGGYDIGPGYAYLIEDMWTTIGIQSIYVCDGVTNYSNIISTDLEGNIYVTPAADVVSIQQVNAAARAKVIYNLQGQRLNSVQHGINVIDGRKRFVR